MGRSTEGRGLVGGSEETLLEGQIGPLVFTTVVAQLTRGVESTGLAFTHVGGLFDVVWICC